MDSFMIQYLNNKYTLTFIKVSKKYYLTFDGLQHPISMLDWEPN